jgi:hypothetical protein
MFGVNICLLNWTRDSHRLKDGWNGWLETELPGRNHPDVAAVWSYVSFERSILVIHSRVDFHCTKHERDRASSGKVSVIQCRRSEAPMDHIDITRSKSKMNLSLTVCYMKYA